MSYLSHLTSNSQAQEFPETNISHVKGTASEDQDWEQLSGMFLAHVSHLREGQAASQGHQHLKIAVGLGDLLLGSLMCSLLEALVPHAKHLSKRPLVTQHLTSPG